ncbi:leucine-rich repeat domain-containing protein [Tundrisphaera sp. TA3]|uniref:leucine-rich repeat domain-containing protein n=1 Tax=Tundrisphaera sp. TA3 TaxID=3435775 RepID=UPI003EBFF99C
MTEPATSPWASRSRIALALMASILLVGAGLAWRWSARRDREQAEAIAAIEAAGGSVIRARDWPAARPSNSRAVKFLPIGIVRIIGLDFSDQVVAVQGRGKLDDAAMSHVARLGGLESVNLDGCKGVTDAGLAQLTGLRRLRSLALPGTVATGSSLRHLAGLHELQLLDLVGVPLADADLAHLAGLRQMRKLSISGESLTDAGLVHVRGLTSMERFGITDAPKVTGEGFVHLRGWVRLESINMTGTGVAGLEKLPTLPALYNIYLSRTAVTDAGLAPITRVAGLLTLELAETAITDACLTTIGKLPRLMNLNLKQTKITDDGLARIAGLTRIADLNLEGTAIGDAGLPHLAAMASLQRLFLGETRVSDAGLPLLAPLTQCSLVGAYGTGVTAEGAASFMNAHPQTQIVR